MTQAALNTAVRPAFGDAPDAANAGGFMPINNIKQMYRASEGSSGPGYYWYDQAFYPIHDEIITRLAERSKKRAEWWARTGRTPDTRIPSDILSLGYIFYFCKWCSRRRK